MEITNENEIRDTLRGTLMRVLDRFSDDGRKHLLPILEHALDRIDELCPQVLVVTPNGHVPARGPICVNEAGFVVVASTPLASGVFSSPGWPDIVPSEACDWPKLVQAIEANDIGTLGPLLSAKMGERGIAKAKAAFSEWREYGFVPALVVLAVAQGGKGGGIVTCLPLPARLDDQIAQITLGGAGEWQKLH